MLLGAYGLLSGNWACILTMIFLMGLQSTLFNPALNGSIPELYPPEQVTQANALLKFVTTTAILLGLALAGFSLDVGLILVACTVVAVALLGFLASFKVYSRPASGSQAAFPWAGPLHSLRDLVSLRGDPLLLLAIFCDCFFYFISLLVVLVINTLGLQELGLSNSQTSLLSVAMMVGVCLGSLLAARISNQQRWTHVLAPGSLGMGLSLLGIGLLISFTGKSSFAAILALFALAGCFGGLFLIPVTSFIQVRPEPQCKGRVLGADNFAAFSGMILAGQLFSVLDAVVQPSTFLMLLGSASVGIALVLWFVVSHTLFLQKKSAERCPASVFL
jgi:predicted MFS family arabinose efflux permease